MIYYRLRSHRPGAGPGTVAAAILIVLLLVGIAGYYLFYSRPATAAGESTSAPPVVSVVTSTVTVTSDETITIGSIGNYTVCFSPGGDCAQNLIDAIDGAKTSLFVMIYTFDDQDISAAVIAAHNRGVDVKILMDTSESGTSEQKQVVQMLQGAGVPLIIYNPHDGILHDKLAIIDNQTVVTGSFNWSYAANLDNDENLLIIHSPALAQQYLTDFEKVWSIASSSSNSSSATTS